MYNETIRKITSLTLLTILVASSAVVGMPNALPHAQAQTSTNANLFVSAENSQFNNYFAGPQVIQVVVADPDINRLDQAYGEPVVTVNGKRLRMAQGTDGNWYAYFADRNQAIAAANTSRNIWQRPQLWWLLWPNKYHLHKSVLLIRTLKVSPSQEVDLVQIITLRQV